MSINLKGRDFLTLLDFTPEEIQYLLDFSAELKAEKKDGKLHKTHEGKNIALIFEKSSTRTRCSFEVAASDLGMGSTYLASGSQIGVKETLADTARVLAGMFDAIEYRGFEQSRVETLAKYSKVPVINGLTNEYHPTQILADFLTIEEHFGKLKGIKLVYMGDAGYNMGDSLMIGCAKMGLHFVACAPDEYYPPQPLIDRCREIAKETGAIIEMNADPMDAVKDADVIYTDVWVSMGRTGGEVELPFQGFVSVSCDTGFDGCGGTGLCLHALSSGISQHRYTGGKRSLQKIRNRFAGSDRGSL